MKFGTHVGLHYTKTSKFSYGAKPDYAWGGCGHRDITLWLWRPFFKMAAILEAI